MGPNELPVYPTPQQAAYGMSAQQANPARRTQRPPANNPSGQQYYKQGPHQQLSQLPPQPTPASYLQNAQSPTYANYAPSQPQQAQYYQQQQEQPRQTLNYYAPQQTQQQHQQQQFQQHRQPQQQPAVQPQQTQYTPQQYYQQPVQQQQQHHQQPQQQQQQLQAPQHQYTKPYEQYLAQAPQYQSSVQSPAAQHAAPQQATSHIPTKKPPHTNRSRENVNEQPKLSNKQRLENELRSTFERVDTNRSGRILARELSLALTNFDNTRFQDLTVRLMIKLFTNESALGLNFEQFVSLWKYLTAYKKLFVAADANKLGDISFGEFQRIIEQIGYKLNVDLVLHLFQKFANKDYSVHDNAIVGKLKFDAFIELLVYLRKLTDIFKQYDKDLSGVATINYLDFLFEISNLT